VLIPGAIKTKKSQCAESQRNKTVLTPPKLSEANVLLSQCPHSCSTSALAVPRTSPTWLCTIGNRMNRAFPVAAAKAWNSLPVPSEVTVTDFEI